MQRFHSVSVLSDENESSVKKMIPMFNFLIFCIIYCVKFKPEAIVGRNGCRRTINTTDRTSVMAQWNFGIGLVCSQGPLKKSEFFNTSFSF